MTAAAARKSPLRKLREESSQGVSAVVLTPHYYAEKERPEKFLERREASERRLSEVIGESGEGGSLPELFLGRRGESVFRGDLVSGAPSRAGDPGGTRYILLEMPFEPWPESVFRELNGIKAMRASSHHRSFWNAICSCRRRRTISSV